MLSELLRALGAVHGAADTQRCPIEYPGNSSIVISDSFTNIVADEPPRSVLPELPPHVLLPRQRAELLL